MRVIDFSRLDDATGDERCDNCGGSSGLVGLYAVAKTNRRRLIAVLDDECVGTALEISTGHAILNQLHQWNLMHSAAATIGAMGHASRRAKKQRDEREAQRAERQSQPFSKTGRKTASNARQHA